MSSRSPTAAPREDKKLPSMPGKGKGKLQLVEASAYASLQEKDSGTQSQSRDVCSTNTKVGSGISRHPPVAKGQRRKAAKGDKAVPISFKKQQRERQHHFDQSWNDYSLHTDLDPVKLADRIVLMRKQGAHPKSSAMMAANRIREKGDAVCEARCLGRLGKVNTYLSRELKEMSQHPHLSKLEESKQLELCLQEAFAKADKNDKKRKRTSDLVQSSANSPLALSQEAEMTIKRAGRMLEEHLQSKELDLKEMALKDLATEIRELKTPTGMGKGHFTKSIYRYIQHARGESNENMETMRQRHIRERKLAAKRVKDEQRQSQRRDGSTTNGSADGGQDDDSQKATRIGKIRKSRVQQAVT